MSVEALKEQARRFEQKEQWGKALDLYVQAISRLDQDDHQDISLFNRAGDLSTRVGNIQAAVEQYERAVDLYVEAELPNNAIAVCKKVIRNLPTRHTTYLRMGQIRAAQGFLTDARANFLAYAERMQGEGQIDEALRALIEFADLAPDDHEIRVALASQFEQREQVGEAVEQLTQAHQVLTRMGMQDQAQEIADKIEELSPGTEIPAPGPATVGASAKSDDFAFKAPAVRAPDQAVEVELGEFSLDSDADDESTAEEPTAEEPTEEVAAADSDLASLEVETEVGDADEESEIEDDDSPLPTFDFDEDADETKDADEIKVDEEIEDDDSPLPTLEFDEDETAALEVSEADQAIEEAVEDAVADAREEGSEAAEAVEEVEEAVDAWPSFG